jgi:hypothetical protein
MQLRSISTGTDLAPPPPYLILFQLPPDSSDTVGLFQAYIGTERNRTSSVLPPPSPPPICIAMTQLAWIGLGNMGRVSHCFPTLPFPP